MYDGLFPGFPHHSSRKGLTGREIVGITISGREGLARHGTTVSGSSPGERLGLELWDARG